MERVVKLVDDKGFRSKLARASRAIALEKYDWSLVAHLLVGVYDDL